MATSAGDKTEKPTPQRLKKAREQGQFLTSRGLVGAIQFLVFVVLVGGLIPKWKDQLQLSGSELIRRAMDRPIEASDWPVLLSGFFVQTLVPVLECGAILFALSVSAHLALTRAGFSLQAATPKFERLNSLSRLRELPAQNLKSLLQAVGLAGALSWLIYAYLEDNAVALLRLPFESVHSASVQIGDSIQGLLWKSAAIFVLFGAIDVFQQYRKHMSGLRMTKQEIRDENKRMEGDPQLKGRIRRLRRDFLRRQMIKEVPKATAVVVNPTHFAVAIRYDMESMPCPMVVAKGKNWLALRIRQIAMENQIPIIENPPLARALYESIDVGRAVSPEFYKAIAEILAYVYRLMGRKLPG